MVKTLGDWEVDGIPVDLSGLRRIRDSLADQLSRAKDAAIDEVGRTFNLDSEKEVTAVLRMNPIVAKVVGFRKVNSGLLEELAIAQRCQGYWLGTSGAKRDFGTSNRLSICS